MMAKLQTQTAPPTTGSAVEANIVHLMDALPDAVLLLDEDWRIAYANQTARRLSHITPEQMNRETLWALYPEIVGTPLEQAYREVAATHTMREVEAFWYAPFKTWFAVRVLPMPVGVAVHYQDVTAIRMARNERVETEERLALALAASNGVGIWDWDVANDRVYADPPFAKLYGVDPEDAARGVPIAYFTRNIPMDDLVGVGPAIDAAVRDGSEFVSQYRIRQADGMMRWVSARGRCTHDSTGAPLRFNGVIIDITDQKQQEEALRDSEVRYRILTELSPLSQWSANAEGLVLFANQRFLEYIGQDFVPKTGKEYLACFDEQDRQRVFDVWSHSVTTGEDYAIDARLIRAKDGASRWWHLRALPVRDESGVIHQWLGTAIDIHDTRTAADLLRSQYDEIDRQRREMETIYRLSPISMALFEPTELRLIRLNDRLAEIHGRPSHELLGRTLAELAPGVGDVHNIMRRAAQGEAILNMEIEGSLPTAPHEKRFWNVNYSPIFGDDGEVQAVASASIEITQQKRAEAALIQSEKLAAVGRMASSIAHEINNPLESVTNLIYIARSYAVLPEVQHFLDLADQELRRVSIIANQTLRFHKQATLPREISCTDLYATVLSLYEGRLRNSAISVENRKRAGRRIACFEGDIRQILNNLVGNAIDAMPAGGRLLLRSREATDWRSVAEGLPARRGLVLTVADTGTGMSAATLAHAFEAFFTTKGMSGTGLGLWISAEIAQRHHGRLRLRSSQRVGWRGTVFSLFLPFDGLAPTTTGRVN